VTGLSTNTGSTAGGALVTISGDWLSDTSEVLFGSVPATQILQQSDNSLTVIAPSQAAGPYDVTVVAPSGTSATSPADQFTDTVAHRSA
jgi:hypothetical protein